MANFKTSLNYSTNDRANAQSGFSILETLITLSLFSTLMLIAMPSFASMMSKSKIQATTKVLFDSLALARTASLSQGSNVLVCQLSPDNHNNCIQSPRRNANWATGWHVYVDLNQNNELDDFDHILSTQRPIDGVAIIFNQNGRLRFFPDGSARSAGFLVCGANSKLYNHIKILHSGRVRAVKMKSNRSKKTCLEAI